MDEKLIIDKDKVLIERIKTWEETTNSGLIIIKTSDSEEEKIERGRILSIGPEVENYSVDNIAVFRRFVGKSLIFNNKDCVIIRETELEGIIENGEIN